MKSAVIRDEECVEGEEEALILFAEALRRSMSKYARTVKRCKRYAAVAFVEAVVVAAALLLLTQGDISMLMYTAILSALSLALGFYLLWKSRRLRPEYKIRSIERMEYPIALYREEDGRFIVFDAGGAAAQKEYSFPAIKDTDRLGNSVVQIRNQMKRYWDLLDMGGFQQAETLRAMPDFGEVTASGKIEQIVEIPMGGLVDSMDETNIERTRMRAPVIERDDPVIDEIESLACFAALETNLPTEERDMGILVDRGLCMEISPEDLMKQARSFRKWSKEALEQDIMTLVKDVVVELDEEFSELRHILMSTPALIEATLPYSVSLHEDFMYFHFCPQCRLSDLEEAERETDFRRWVNEKILGNALDDTDLVHPHTYGDPDTVERIRERIEATIRSNLPLADPVFPVILADLRELTMDELGSYHCEVCGLQGEGIKVPRSVHPLASAYLLNLREQAKHIQKKSDVIIRNVHDVIMNKESKLVSLGAYEQSVQQAEQSKLTVKGDLDAANEVEKVVRAFEKSAERGRR